jgi:hypothetical protein
MPSNIVGNFAGWSFSLTGGDLLVLALLAFVVATVVVIGLSREKRGELVHTRFADILIVQLERIGDTLDRIVSQNAAVIEALNQKTANAPTLQTAATIEKASVRKPEREAEAAEQPLDDGKPLSEPVRSVISMLRASPTHEGDMTNS